MTSWARSTGCATALVAACLVACTGGSGALRADATAPTTAVPVNAAGTEAPRDFAWAFTYDELGDLPPFPLSPDYAAPEVLVVHAVAAEDESPIQGAEVVVTADTVRTGVSVSFRPVGRRRRADVTPVLARGLTDDSGAARFEIPGRRNAKVSVRARGRRTVADDHVAERGADSPAVFSLEVGAAADGVAVDAETGRPLEGVTVTARPVADSVWPPDPGVCWETTSGGRGSFRVEGLPRSGAVEVIGTARGYAPSTARLTVGTPDAASASQRFQIRLARPVTIRGTLRRAAGDAVGEARVHVSELSESALRAHLSPLPWPPHWGMGNRAVANAQPDGSFELPDLEAGKRYTLYAIASHPAARAWAGEVVGSTDPSVTTELVLRPFPRAFVRLLDGAGAPVRAESVRWDLDGQGGYRSLVDADGWSEVAPGLGGLNPGRRHLLARLQGGPAVEGTITLPEAGQVRTVLVVEERDRVEGRLVRSPEDRGALMSLEAQPVVAIGGHPPWGMASTSLVGADGTFRFDALPRVPHRIVLEWWNGEGRSLLAEVTPPVAGLVLSAVRPALVEVRVKGLAAASPVHVGALPVTARGDPFAVEARVVDGTVHVALPAGGLWRLVLHAPEIAPAVVEVDASLGKTVTAGPLALDAGRVVTGRVVDESGAPIPGARVTFAPDAALRDTERAFSRTAGAQGQFRLSGAPRDSADLLVEAAGFVSRRVVALARATAEPIEIVLRRGTRVAGVVRTVSGHAVFGARLHLRPADAAEDPGVDAALPEVVWGGFEGYVPAGRWIVEARGPGGLSGSREFEVAGDRAATIVIVVTVR